MRQQAIRNRFILTIFKSEKNICISLSGKIIILKEREKGEL